MGLLKDFIATERAAIQNKDKTMAARKTKKKQRHSFDNTTEANVVDDIVKTEKSAIKNKNKTMAAHKKKVSDAATDAIAIGDEITGGEVSYAGQCLHEAGGIVKDVAEELFEDLLILL